MKLAAVIYDPKVTIIWGIIRDFFKENSFDLEPVFYKDYKMQVDGLMNGEVDVAWNSPLAWLDTFLRSGGKSQNGMMRDTDRDRQSFLVVKNSDEFNEIADLKNKTIGFGAYDSPQARLIPILNLYQNGLEFNKDYTEKRFDIGLGLHGDHIGGELDSLKAFLDGKLDASWMLDLNYTSWVNNGTIDETKVKILYKTPKFDHCIFSANPNFSSEKFAEFCKILSTMDYSNPAHKEMMDMEGLKKWVDGRTSGFKQITKANEYLKFFG